VKLLFKEKNACVTVVDKLLIQSSSENGTVYTLLKFHQKSECLLNKNEAGRALLNQHKNNDVFYF
jgi:hypothetical protein